MESKAVFLQNSFGLVCLIHLQGGFSSKGPLDDAKNVRTLALTKGVTLH